MHAERVWLVLQQVWVHAWFWVSILCGRHVFCCTHAACARPQISIFVLPLIVLVGWIIGKPFTLNFDPFATIMLTLSVIHAYFVSSDGNSNWCAAVAILWALRERLHISHSKHQPHLRIAGCINESCVWLARAHLA